MGLGDARIAIEAILSTAGPVEKQMGILHEAVLTGARTHVLAAAHTGGDGEHE